MTSTVWPVSIAVYRKLLTPSDMALVNTSTVDQTGNDISATFWSFAAFDFASATVFSSLFTISFFGFLLYQLRGRIGSKKDNINKGGTNQKLFYRRCNPSDNFVILEDSPSEDSALDDINLVTRLA